MVMFCDRGQATVLLFVDFISGLSDDITNGDVVRVKNIVNTDTLSCSYKPAIAKHYLEFCH
jgi:hypothetical protein